MELNLLPVLKSFATLHYKKLSVLTVWIYSKVSGAKSFSYNKCLPGDGILTHMQPLQANWHDRPTSSYITVGAELF